MKLTSRLLFFIFFLTLLSSCKKETPLRVYQAPKDPIKSMALSIDVQGGARDLGADSIPTPISQAPAAWKVQPLDRVRKGLWHAENGYGTVEISLTAFPGDVGGDLANVNRWLGQIQLPALDSLGLESVSTHLTVGGYEGRLVFLGDVSQAEKAIIALILPVKGVTYFIKGMGPYAAVVEERPIFEAFLTTLSFTPNVDS